MQTLVIMMISAAWATTSTDGNSIISGAISTSSAVTTLDFSDQKQCEEAAKALAAQDVPIGDKDKINGLYRVVAKCVARKQ